MLLFRLPLVIRLAPAHGVLRGGAVAGCSTALAMAAHMTAGGTAHMTAGGVPDTGLVMLVMVLLAAGGAGLARHCRSLPWILAMLAGTQVVLHFLLASAEMHQPAQAVLWPGWHMVAAHAVAVLVTALVLTKAATAVFAVAAALARVIPRPLGVLPVGSADHDPVIVAEPVDHLVRVLLRLVYPERGPPFCF